MTVCTTLHKVNGVSVALWKGLSLGGKCMLFDICITFLQLNFKSLEIQLINCTVQIKSL